jgi:hypothetical protein
MRNPPTWNADDVRLVADAILEAPRCVPCIVRATGVTRARVDAILDTLGETFNVNRTVERCGACGVTGDVYRMA